MIPTAPVRAPYGARPGIVRCLTSVRNFQKSLKKSAVARPGTGRCPSGHQPMFYESNCHRWEATCFCRRTYCIYIDISLLKTLIQKNIFCLSSWGWLTCNEQVLLIFLQSWASVFFFTITVRVSLNLSYFNKLFLLKVWLRILIYIYSLLHVKIRVKSTGHRTVSGWYLTTPAGHRTTSYGARPGIGRCFHIQTPVGARTICDHAKENS